MADPLFRWSGGKRTLKLRLWARFPPHVCYVDVFGGAASVLLGKPPSPREVFNDLSGDICNFFRVVKHRPAELVEAAVYYLHSRRLWDEVKTLRAEDEILRALRFWFITSASFGGRQQHFGTAKSGGGASSRYVTIENLDFADCLRRYDSPDSFFYLDPPYRGTKGATANYPHLTDDRWHQLAALLRSVNGKWLLSHTPDPLVNQLLPAARYPRETVRVATTLQRVGKAKASRQEWLIRNFGGRTKGE